VHLEGVIVFADRSRLNLAVPRERFLFEQQALRPGILAPQFCRSCGGMRKKL
jgi:hypothetical protein